MQHIPEHLESMTSLFTAHALERMAQRRIPIEGVLAAFDWGQRAKQPQKAWSYLLGARQAMEAARQGVDVTRYIGIKVIESNGKVVTAYWVGR